MNLSLCGVGDFIQGCYCLFSILDMGIGNDRILIVVIYFLCFVLIYQCKPDRISLCAVLFQFSWCFWWNSAVHCNFVCKIVIVVGFSVCLE